MTLEEKLALLEETIEAEEGSLQPETNLSDVEEYDSMSKLSIIVMMEDEFGVKLTGETFKQLVTVEDILKLMQ